ncbi:MAG: ABC transporter substrate-binding protein, partial [Ilumatobacteraceae bacterium]
MRITKRSSRYAALAVGLAFIAVSCGSDSTSSNATTAASAGATTPAATDTTAVAAPETTAGGTETTAASTGGAAMTLTMEINPKAVWDDGSKINFGDFECTMNAILKTPGSLSTTGYDKITSLEQGKDDHEVIAKFSEVYAPYKNLFSGILKKAAVKDCNDVSADFADNIPFSARPYKIASWSLDQLVLAKNDNYFGDDKATVDKVVMVPKADSDT